VASTAPLLIEGKSHPGELRPTRGCDATSESFEKIEDALAKTREWIGAEETDHTWTGPLYQTANRFAYLYFLRTCLGIKAWLAHRLFVSDPTHPPTRATTEEQWEVILDSTSVELGLPPTVEHYSHLYLPGLPRPSTPSVTE